MAASPQSSLTCRPIQSNVGCAPFGMNAAMSKPLVLQFLGRSDLGVFWACRKYKHVGFVGHKNTLRFACVFPRRNTGISGREPGSTSGSRHGVGDRFTALRRQGLIADQLVLQLATFLRSLDL